MFTKWLSNDINDIKLSPSVTTMENYDMNVVDERAPVSLTLYTVKG